ncbi:hypothetical protein BDY17DRAFT_182781 [Neohortaea acidophila]|uniref:Uncharacterized protein n=1 Tax=Neohortaea acidophila TaxID=245834 RepID=A0A6A6PLX4_9PEZI|nr:uncharacterized protein BDY17DRAFT_182781 [Neohortaea acidophila]KAF2481098.1 hypothetical protein BDY17DRAFT_182781 [Neohortaea acidophila]
MLSRLLCALLLALLAAPSHVFSFSCGATTSHKSCTTEWAKTKCWNVETVASPHSIVTSKSIVTVTESPTTTVTPAPVTVDFFTTTSVSGSTTTATVTSTTTTIIFKYFTSPPTTTTVCENLNTPPPKREEATHKGGRHAWPSRVICHITGTTDVCDTTTTTAPTKTVTAAASAIDTTETVTTTIQITRTATSLITDSSTYPLPVGGTIITISTTCAT